MSKRNEKVIVVATASELHLIFQSLLALRNTLITKGRCTEPVDELLAKIYD